MAEFEEHPSKAAARRYGGFVVLPDAEAEDCTIWFRLEPDADSDMRWEGLLGRRLSDDRARVCAVPFWVYDLNLGDEVRIVTSAEGALIATESIHDSGNYTFRVSFNTDGRTTSVGVSYSRRLSRSTAGSMSGRHGSPRSRVPQVMRRQSPTTLRLGSEMASSITRPAE